MTPERAFTAVVPLLIGLATILFAAAGGIQRWILSRAARPNGLRVSTDGLRLLLLAPVAIYGGYFGAGMSVMLLAIFSVSDTGDFRATNVMKNLLSGLTSLVAVVVFVFQGMVAWPPTLVMMGGALIGGFLGGRLARVLPPTLIRGIVITVGLDPHRDLRVALLAALTPGRLNPTAAGSIPGRLGQNLGVFAAAGAQVREFRANADLGIVWHWLRIAGKSDREGGDARRRERSHCAH